VKRFKVIQYISRKSINRLGASLRSWTLLKISLENTNV